MGEQIDDWPGFQPLAAEELDAHQREISPRHGEHEQQADVVGEHQRDLQQGGDDEHDAQFR